MERMELVDVQCPYCGRKRVYSVERGWKKTMVVCDEENGGCGGEFAVAIKVTIEPTVYRLVQASPHVVCPQTVA